MTEALWRQAEELRSDLRLRLRISAANVVGSAVVAIEIVVVGLPGAGISPTRFRRDNLISGLALFAYLLVALPVEDRLTRRRLDSTFGWIGDHVSPTWQQIKEVLDYPWVQARRILAWWIGGMVLFVGLNFVFGNNTAYCLRTGVDIVLGGLTSSALSFLILERYNRPVFALALLGHSDAPPARVGLQRRLLLIWALGAVVPVTVIVSAPAGLTTKERAGLTVPLVIVGSAALAIGLALTVAAARSITEPIDALRRCQRQVEDGDLSVEARVDDGGEVGLLQAGFNRMVAGLRERQRIRDLFGRHVGDEVAQHALSDERVLGGELRSASVLFIDLIGSTGLAQRLPPDEVVAMLNQFFEAVVRASGAYGGWVNKFEGDAALCVFGPPTEREDHAASALQAARSMRSEMAIRFGPQSPGLDAGIGVSTGTVLAGNVGAEHRYEYTVIGDPVNEAARLCEVAKRHPARVLASGAAVSVSGDEAVNWEACGARRLRGRRQPTDIYQPSGASAGAASSARTLEEDSRPV